MLSAQLNDWTASELHWQWPSRASFWLSRVLGQLLTHLCVIQVLQNMLALHLVRALLNKLLVVSLPISIFLSCICIALCVYLVLCLTGHSKQT